MQVRIRVVSEIEFWGKKVGDQCIFAFLLMQNPSKRLPSFCQQKSRGFQIFKPNFYKWPWDWFLGVKKRFLRSLVKLGFKVSRSFLVKLENKNIIKEIKHVLRAFIAWWKLRQSLWEFSNRWKPSTTSWVLSDLFTNSPKRSRHFTLGLWKHGEHVLFLS